MSEKSLNDSTELTQKIAAARQHLANAQAELDALMVEGEGAATISPDRLRDAQAALARSQERYDRLVTRMSAIVFELAPDGTVKFVNDALTAITGYRPEALIGHSWWNMLCPGVLYAQCERFNARVENSDVSGYELTLAAQDGQELIFEINTANRYGADDRLKTIVGFGINITKRRNAERALQDSEARFRQLAENIDAVFWLTDWPENRVQYVSPAFEHIWGISAKQLYSEPMLWTGAIVPEERDYVAKAFMEGVAKNRFDITYRIRRPDGGIRWIEDRGFAVRDEQGEVVRIAGVAQDVTARKEAEEALRRREQEFRTMIESWPDIVARFDKAQRHLYVSPAVEQATGVPPQAFIGKTNREIGMPEESVRAWEESIRWVFETGELYTTEFSFAGPKGTLYFENRLLPEFGPDGTVQTVLAWSRDITERKQAEQQLKLAAAVFESSNEAVLITDAAGKIIMVNHSFSRISGFEPSDVIGNDLGALRSDQHDTGFHRRMWQELTHSGNWQGEVWNRRKSGEVYPAWHNIGEVIDEQGRVQNYVVVFSDISEIKEAEERMSHLAHHDALTGIPNRLLFNANLDQAIELARRRKRKLALLFLDLDRFKIVNDTLGHAVGDVLLQTVAARLKKCVRAEDTVARLGGDEFVVILTEIAHPGDAAPIALEMIEQVAKPIPINSQNVIASTSIGISIFPNDADNGDELVRAADMALYKAKASGRHNYQFFTEELTELSLAQLSVEQGLHHALEHQEFEVFYQPLVALESGRIAGVEALLRWHHPEKGVLGPAEFIAVAEESGLIEPIGEWVLRTACKQVLAWQGEGLAPLRISINVSTQQILRGGFLATLHDIIRRCGALPKGLQIDLEITENVLQVVEQHQELLAQIKELGVMLAIDDFGTGYSSLSRLKALPIDIVKIDQSFVRDIPHRSDDNAIAGAIVAMAHSMNIKVVAEGIENREQLGFLRSLHCEEGQGFLFSEPVPAQVIHDFIAHGKRFEAAV